MDSETRNTLERIEQALTRIEHRQDAQLKVKEVRDWHTVNGWRVRNILHIFNTPEGIIIEID